MKFIKGANCAQGIYTLLNTVTVILYICNINSACTYNVQTKDQNQDKCITHLKNIYTVM